MKKVIVLHLRSSLLRETIRQVKDFKNTDKTRLAWLTCQAIKRTRAENPLIMEIRRSNRGSTNLEIGFDTNANSCLFYWCRTETGRGGSRDVHVSRNALRMEFNDHWHSRGHIAQKKDTFFCTINSSPSSPSLPSQRPCTRHQRTTTVVVGAWRC